MLWRGNEKLYEIGQTNKFSGGIHRDVSCPIIKQIEDNKIVVKYASKEGNFFSNVQQ